MRNRLGFTGRNQLLIMAFLGVVAFIWSCNPQATGFVLPDGDIEAGKAAFVELACNECHSINEIDWTGTAEGVEVKLGGEVSSLKTYGQLVTSIINPSHKIARPYLMEKVAVEGQSNMTIYNEVMTVQQLVDIVAFLQSEYELQLPVDHYHYPAW